MPVASGDLKGFKAATMGTTLTTANIGGAISTNQITGATIGEVLFLMVSAASGGAAAIQYEKMFVQNTNATSTLNGAIIWLANLLLAVASNATCQVVSTSSSDGSTLKARILGFDQLGNPQQEDITLNGTTQASGILTWSAVHRVEIRNVSSNALTALTGTLTVTVSTALGVVPSGLYTATSEIAVGLAGTLNDSATTTNPTTAPSGITFSTICQSQASALACANSGVIAPSAAQGLWLKWTLAATAEPSNDCQIAIVPYGGSSS